MDLSLLPTPASNYDKQGTGALFTIRSANSPSYSLSRRHGVRKSRDVLEEVRESSDGSGKKEVYGTHTGTSLTQSDHASTNSYGGVISEENKTSGLGVSAKLSQTRSADKTREEFGTDRNGNCNLAPECRGRTDWIRRDVPNRSRSLDWRRGERSPECSGRADLLRIEEDLRKNTEGQSERTTGGQGVRVRVMSSVGAYSNSSSDDQERNQMSPESMTLNRASRGNSLPSRMRSHSGTASELRGTTATSMPKGGQSILERIEKLYGSAGVGKTTEGGLGGTFPRCLSSGDKSPGPNRKWFTWTQKDAPSPETSPTPPAIKTGNGVSRAQWHRESQDKTSEDRGFHSRRLLEDIGTRSLDRGRSRFTVATQIRATRAAEGFTTPLEANAFVEKEEPNSLIGGRKEQRNRTCGEENTDKFEFRSNSKDEDVFELNSPKNTVKKFERKKFPDRLPVASSASVKNKINQFEALTQRTQSQVLPRRTFSVPTQLSCAHNGVKKSGSERAIRGSRDMWTGSKVAETTSVKTTAGSGRSFSVDEVGLERKEKDGSAEKERGYDFDLHKYTRLKDTLNLPLNSRDQGHQRSFYIDEADFSKALSPEDASKRPLCSTLSNSSDTSCGLHKATPLIVGDEDKTPTNTPTLSPSAEFAALNEKSKNESPPSLPTAQTEKADSPPPCHPLTTWAVSNMVTPPDANTSIRNIEKKSMLDLSAWVAGVNPKVRMWDDAEEDSDDDESTQRDEDSNYDSDSGESSVTITSNMSQSENKSFSVSLSDLCNFAGVDYESDESDNWQAATRRSASLSSDMSVLSCVSVMPAEELDRLLDDVKSLGDSNLQDYSDVQVVVLHKEVGVGLGFSLAGGVDQNKPITVHKVFPSGVAAQEGSIKEGQQVLSINGSPLSDNLHWEALRVLRRAKTRNMGVVVLRRGGTFSTPKDREQKRSAGTTPAESGETGELMCVRLEKNDRDLGFSLEGGVGSSLENRPLTVQKIFQGGPVDKVFPGDEVLEIEGVSMTGKRRLDAWSLIRKLPAGPVDVVICRPVKVQKT